MSSADILIGAVLLLITGFIGRSLLHLFRQPFEFDPERVENFSVTDYSVMTMLLCDEDREFVRRQPAYTRALLRRFKAERRRVFRMYLNQLIDEYRHLDAAAKFVALHSSQAPSEDLRFIFWQGLRFWYQVRRLRSLLLLHNLGLSAPDLKGLFQPVEGTRKRLARLCPSAEQVPSR
jgi:hypothetical protein